MKRNRLRIFISLIAVFASGSQPLCDPIAAGSKKYLGNICASYLAVPSNFKDYWNQLTPENAGKWGTVEATRDVMTWRWLDSAYTYAKANKMPFKAHTLIWGFQEPSWIKTLSAQEQRDEIEEWIKAYGERYPEVDMVDVVNEPFSRPASFRDAIGGSGTTGWDWVIWCFETTRKYFPKAKLLLNEFNIVNSGGRTEYYSQLADLLKERKLIDGVGVQSHYFSIQGGTSLDTIRNNLDKLAQTGLPIHASEMDMLGSDTIQLTDYKNIFPVFWKHPAVAGVTLWGWLQGYTWEDSTFLIRKNGVERPSLKWLREYVATQASVEPAHSASIAIKPLPFSIRAAHNGWLILYLDRPSNIALRMIDLQGRVVFEKTPQFFSRGTHSIFLPPRSRRAPAGIYRMMVKENGVIQASSLCINIPR